MKFLAAFALLFLGVAFAHHDPEHQLEYPRFHVGKQNQYDVEVNITAGVPGMHSQVSKSAIKAILYIHPKSDKELIIQFDRVESSSSLAGVSSKTAQLSLHEDEELQEQLEIPTNAIYENGKITSFSHSNNEKLSVQKIRRSILRTLEIELDERYVKGGSSSKKWPITYNKTKSSAAGKFHSHYIIESIPFPEYPWNQNVFNVSRVDNYEGIPYVAYRSHHNFDKQGCPEVCTKTPFENKFGAGCPSGHEPHRSPLRKSFVARHSLRLTTENILIIGTASTKESHVADVYDQTLEVTVETRLRFLKATEQDTPEVPKQKNRDDLHDLNTEINEEEIESICKYPENSVTIEEVKKLLDEVTSIVLKGEVQDEQSKEIGHKLLTMQKSMQRFKEGNFRTIHRSIPTYDELLQSSDEDKVKRQIWLELLPTIGTEDSVSFIVNHLRDNINLKRRSISFLESVGLLEALPNNIHKPTKNMINNLSGLLETVQDKTTAGYTMFYSASYMAVARVIRDLCAVPSRAPKENSPSNEGRYSLRFLQRSSQSQQSREENAFTDNMVKECPQKEAQDFIDQVTRLLRTTKSNAKRMIYIETLARTGLSQVLPTLREVIYSHHGESLVSGLTRSYIDYLQTASIYALHNIVGQSPKEVQDLLVPMFFNSTETPKIRIAALSVLLKSQPTMSLLQQIAEHSWEEPSVEVGSYITSSFETYGNSSQPCYQLTAHRIKKVLPQVKRVDAGVQKAKNILIDMWDEVRRFGLEKHMDFTPSNESFIPSVMYGSLGYNIDSLKDFIYKYAINVQGLSSHNLYDAILKRLELEPAENIPKLSENKIFPELKIRARDPEFWKITFYQKLFYSTSYYYFDAKDTNKGDFFKMVADLFTHYIKRDSEGQYGGHLVKVYIPSSYHSKTVSQTLSYPIQFEMRSPLLVSMKFKVEKTSSTPGVSYKLKLSPSVYQSTIYSSEILNLDDCKRVGVYHEQKTAATYPFELNFQIKTSHKFSLGYKFPELPKNILSHESEAGTYAGMSYLEPLPSKEERKPIKTIPSQFLRPISFRMVGLPRFEGLIKTEDIQYGMEPIPRNLQEVADYISRHVLNAGWRRKSVEISRVADTDSWDSSAQVTAQVDYTRTYKSPEKEETESEWYKDLKFDDSLDTLDRSAYATEGQKMHKKITRSLSHIHDHVRVTVEQKTKSKVFSSADLNLEYCHTLGGFLHVVHFNSSLKTPRTSSPIQMTGDYAIGFIHRPNEFKYNEKYGDQKGLAIGGISLSKTSPFANPAVIAKAVFKYKPMAEVLNMVGRVKAEQLEPDTHFECLRNKKPGIDLSPACIKAIREKSIYNHIRLHALVLKDTPLDSTVREIGERVDLALKHVFYPHMHITKKHASSRTSEPAPHSVHFEATYIDKMTDKPVLDIVLEKQSEILNFTKISAGWIQPISSIDTLPETLAASLTNNTYPATCSITNNYVTTYDLRSYRMSREEQKCKYVLSTHCTERKKFAVLVQHKFESHGDPVIGSDEVTIHVGSNVIVLVPGSRLSYKIKYNKKDYEIRVLAPKMLNETALITAHVNIASDGTSFVEIHARKAGLKVRYNGESVKVQVHPRYKGELCGLCSEFNGEVSREFRGVDRCLYNAGSDFARSSIVGHNCNREPRQGALCNDEVVARSDRWHEEQDELEGQEPSVKRNVVMQRGSQICFSTKPVPVCGDGLQPTEYEPQNVEFHCLPKQDVNARKMVTESKRRILGELETKAVDLTESVDVAKMC